MNALDYQLNLETMYSKANIDKIVIKEIDSKSTLFTRTMDVLASSCCFITDHAYETFDMSIKDCAHAVWIEVLKDSKDKHIQSIGTLIGNRFGYDGVTAINKGTEVIVACAEIGIYDLILFDNSKIVKPTMRLSLDVVKSIDKLQYQPPMVCIPNPWKANDDGGWLSLEKHVVLGEGNHHKGKQNLACLNKLQLIPWEIDQHVLFNFIDNKEYKGDREILIDFLDKPFYFVWRYDKRGRMYSEGYNINLQSNELRKSMITIAKAEKLSKEGIMWLKVGIANAFGKDKWSFNKRIAWFNSCKSLDLDKAEDKIIASKLVNAYQKGQNGDAVKSNMFLDATNSGMQVMAALSNCSKTAKAVNMIGKKRMDAYQVIADLMNDQLDKSDHVNREETKYPLMTHYYNSKERPRQEFNDAQLGAFYNALDGQFPGAEDVMSSINECWEDKDHYVWTLPDGHKAVIRSKVTSGTSIHMLGGEFYYEYTEYKASGNGNHLAPNIIHSIDGYIAREMVKRCEFPLAHIHDAFTCHPNHMDDVCWTYKSIMAEIADSNLLQDILREITGNNSLIYKKLGSSLAKDIKASSHMLS